MVKATGEARLDMITNLLSQILAELIAAEWELSTTVYCYQGIGNSLERGNYRGLMLTYQILKTPERITEKLIRQKMKKIRCNLVLYQDVEKKHHFYLETVRNI